MDIVRAMENILSIKDISQESIQKRVEVDSCGYSINMATSCFGANLSDNKKTIADPAMVKAQLMAGLEPATC